MEIKKAVYQSPGEPGKRGFEDLDCYRMALDILVNAYELANQLPSVEKYDLAVQIRRSAKSVTANIAEGYGRYHYLDSLKSYAIARGELNETLSHFINAKALSFIDPVSFEQVYKLIRRVEQALNGFMAFVRRQYTGEEDNSSRAVRDDLSENDYTIEPIPENDPFS